MAKRGVKVLPDKAELIAWDREGLTYDQMIARIRERTGETVTRGGLSMARKRAGLPARLERYDDLLPWTLREADLNSWTAELLRAEARRRRNLPVKGRPSTADVDRWLERMKAHDSVLWYEPDGVGPDGRRQVWWYVKRIPEDQDIVRMPEVEVERRRRESR